MRILSKWPLWNHTLSIASWGQRLLYFTALQKGQNAPSRGHLQKAWRGNCASFVHVAPQVLLSAAVKSSVPWPGTFQMLNTRSACCFAFKTCAGGFLFVVFLIAWRCPKMAIVNCVSVNLAVCFLLFLFSLHFIKFEFRFRS